MIFYSSYIIIQVNQCQPYLFSQGPRGLWKTSKLFRIFGNSILFRLLSSSWVSLSSSSRGRSEGRRPVSQQSPGGCLSPPPRLSCHSHFWGKSLVPRPAPNELYISHLWTWCFYHILFVFLKPRALSFPFCTGSIPKTQLETQMLSEPEFPTDLGTLHTSSEAPVFPFSPFPWVPCHTKLLPLSYPQDMAMLTQMVSILIPTKYCVV